MTLLLSVKVEKGAALTYLFRLVLFLRSGSGSGVAPINRTNNAQTASATTKAR